jgi:hypothetical protein
MMSSRRTVRLFLVIALVAVCCAWLAVTAGCGTATKTTKSQNEVQKNSESTGPKDGATTESTEPSQKSTEKTTPGSNQEDVEAVTNAAMASANANNPSLGPLDVLGVKIVDSWARVDMQPKNKSADGASWLLKKVNGTWTVVEFGTSIMPSDHPDAPSAVFQ